MEFEFLHELALVAALFVVGLTIGWKAKKK